MSQFHVVVPARFGSQRLPGKALLDIAGKPMLQRVYEQVRQSTASRVVIATDDARIEACARSFGAEVCMTSQDHPSGTDRVEEVTRRLGFEDDQVIVNVQGDEPLIPPSVINQVAENLETSGAAMASLFESINTIEEVLDPNKVKVVTDQSGLALYFSRAAIPYARDTFPAALPADSRYKRHVGIYAYRVAALRQFVGWPEDDLEKIEKLEQLRMLRRGLKIHMAEAREQIPPGVDTEQDLERTRRVFQ